MNQLENKNPLQDQKQLKRVETFGPSVQSLQLEKKQIEDDSKKNLTVSFKLDDQIILVENWKQYNTDVSNPNSNKKTKHKPQGCWNVCITF